MELLVIFLVAVLIGGMALRVTWRARSRYAAFQPIAVRAQSRLRSRSRRVDWR